MSGGHFEYAQYRLHDISKSIDELIAKNDCTDKSEFGYDIGRHYPIDIIDKFKETSRLLKQCEAMAQRIDWLVSDDDGEDSFRERWIKEVENKFG